MRRGRRPKPGGEIQLNPQAQEVQTAVDETALLLLEAIKGELHKKIKDGDMTKLSLTSLTRELRGLLQAIKKPNSTLMYMSAPQSPQIEENVKYAGRRDLEFNHIPRENLESLRKSQQNFLDSND